MTDPIDETMSLDDFEDLARTHWIDRLLLAKQMAKLSPPAVQLEGRYYVGLPSAQPYPDK